MESYGSEPAGKQAIGIINIVWGALGALGWCAMGVGALFVGGIGGAIAASGADGGGAVGGLIGGLALFAGLIFLANAALHGLLIAGGISILQNKPNGRRLSLTYAWIAAVLAVAGVLLSGFHATVPGIIGLIYPVVLLVLLNQPDWKAAFP
jgi:hypothetical protein